MSNSWHQYPFVLILLFNFMLTFFTTSRSTQTKLRKVKETKKVGIQPKKVGIQPVT